ncbi:MAG: PTS sugar transporter subunit IIA [Anaerolineae bacterium]
MGTLYLAERRKARQEVLLIGVLLVSHGALAQEMVRTASILVPVRGAVALGLQVDETPESFEVRIRDVLGGMPSADGLLVLADLVGGTPYQRAVSAGQAYPAGLPYVVVGPMNLAMVVEALLGLSQAPFEELVAHVERAGGAVHAYRRELSQHGP